MSLANKKCVPCEVGAVPLDRGAAEAFLRETPGWQLDVEAIKISKKFKFKDFKEALSFTNRVGDIAEAEGHHPDIDLHWGRAGITLSTHSIGGLSENDFILAAKIDAL